jgi:hypothetical protein
MKETKKLIDSLVGETIIAFGSKSHCYWGHSEKEQSFKISQIEIQTDSDEEVLLEVYLENYDVKQFGFIYTDEKFLNSINSILIKKGFSEDTLLDYTEQGMQGRNYIHMIFGNKW